jgi:oligoribonuclease NrnB/cAMP/cGMP phosphodiesterase (DHH superfamily)
MNAVKNVIVYHSNCPDGAASAIVAKKINPSIHPVRGFHDKIDNQVIESAKNLKEKGCMWIVDISCTEPALEETCQILLEKNCKLGVYEHHISQAYLADFIIPEQLEGEIIFDNDRCGSKIFFDRMLEDHPSKLENLKGFIRLTNDRDLWINDDPMSAELSSLHNIYGDDRYVQRFIKNASIEFTEPEQVLLKFEKERLLKRMHHLLSTIKTGTDKNGVPYGIMVGEGKASEVCNVAIHKFNLEYVILLDYNSKRASIRSNKTFDCATFSKTRGGGGHARAAGFSISRQDFNLEDL